MTTDSRWVAVADLHGHLEHFEALVQHADSEFGDDWMLCTLGDYVDNGPRVFELLERLIELRASRCGRFFPIVGNHDLALLRALGWPEEAPDEAWYEQWRRNYWDLDLGTPEVYTRRGGDRPPPQSAAAFNELFPQEHREFLAALPWYHDTGRFLFVHAGMERGALAPQIAPLAERALPGEHLHLPAPLRDKKLSRIADPNWDRLVVSAHNKHLGAPRFEGPQRICLSAEVDATAVLHAVVLPERTWLKVGGDGQVRVES